MVSDTCFICVCVYIFSSGVGKEVHSVCLGQSILPPY